MRLRLAAALIAAGLVGAPVPAAAHDDLAPPGAPHQWLPDEDWVMEHRIPFDQARLQRALGLEGRRLEAYLFNDHRTPAELARRQGIGVEALADHLVAPWHGRVGADRIATLRDRTVRLLTQGHLAQHAFFHVFHKLGLPPASRRLFGVSSRRLGLLRRRGLTPLQVARRHGGLPLRELIAGLRDHVRRRHRRALATNEAWPAQADRLLARQLRLLPCWVRRRAPPADPGNPYGKARLQHGPHARRWPRTALEWRENDVAVERVRRRLRQSCWPRVARWNGPSAPGASPTWALPPAVAPFPAPPLAVRHTG
jgi:hypothetical protein